MGRDHPLFALNNRWVCEYPNENMSQFIGRTLIRKMNMSVIKFHIQNHS
jgi:hypothetical protein